MASAATLSQRIRAIQPSATLAVDASAKQMRAAGVEIVSFAAGEPDFATPEHIVQAAARATRDQGAHKYTPAPGLLRLREAIAVKADPGGGAGTVQPTNVVVTNGAKQAIFSALAAIVEPGDDVLLPRPYWTTYPEVIGFFGGRTVTVTARTRSTALPTVEDLEARRTPRTKALIWCSPSNPTGAVADKALTQEVLQWTVAHDIWVVSDEIYHQLYYGDGVAARMSANGPLDDTKVIVVDGVSKSHAMTGWRVGWVIASEPVAAAITRLQSHMVSNVSNVAQEAALAAVTGPEDDVAHMVGAFARRRNIMVAALTAMAGITLEEPMGAFYTFPDVTGLSRALRVDSSQELAMHLLERAHVATVAGEAFGMPGHLRLSYALSDADLELGMSRIAAIANAVGAA